MMTSGEKAAKRTIIPLELDRQADERGGPFTKLGRWLVLRQFARICEGELRVFEAGREHRFGRRTPRCDISVTIHVDHPRLFADAAFGGTVGAGEAYIHGLWRCDDLTGLVRLFVVNREFMNGMDDGRWALATRPLLQLFHRLNRNTRGGSARNVTAHYDLGNDLYEIMLDESMAYSCGIFEREDASLHEAQLAKYEAVCRKLALAPGDRVVEIGTGWGGLAMHAARHYGCHVTTTTISREQYDYVRERIARVGLADRITLLLEDYRDLRGRYDKAMSIEMIEAVGAGFLEHYLARCAALLEPHGAMLLQAITIQDQFYERARRSVDYIQRFVFPGSFIPSVSAIASALTRATDLKIFHLEDIGLHYARTLRLWRERFFARLGEIRRLGYPESFVRLWEYYLCYCEGGFAERQLGNVQMLLTKPHCRLPPVGHLVAMASPERAPPATAATLR